METNFAFRDQIVEAFLATGKPLSLADLAAHTHISVTSVRKRMDSLLRMPHHGIEYRHGFGPGRPQFYAPSSAHLRVVILALRALAAGREAASEVAS